MTVAHAQKFLVNDELLLPIPQIFALCTLSKHATWIPLIFQSVYNCGSAVSSTNSNPLVRLTVNTLRPAPHTDSSEHPGGSSPSQPRLHNSKVLFKERFTSESVFLSWHGSFEEFPSNLLSAVELLSC